ncbi:MAG: hypothetical protein LC798_13530 [Chloroflexi bacterium]|nr:hypothetical protein [Chloroflexota bacterium]
MASDKLAWLDKVHPIYEATVAEWESEEQRLRGGLEVVGELRRFEWENDADYATRQGQAVYLNFPDLYATTMVGHLMTEHPAVDAGLDFGTMGRVQREDGQRDPSLAELVYYNVDGVGNDGSQWPAWWTGVGRRAQGTGHRWITCDLPREGSASLADVMAGARPFLVELSPLSVTNWHFVRGRLEFAVIRIAERAPQVNDKGEFLGNEMGMGYLVYTRGPVGATGAFDALGAPFLGGGWWRLDAEKELVENGHGTWDAFRGQVPLWPHFGERDTGITGKKAAMSRSSTLMLGQAAVAYMNLESAAEFDAWDAAMSKLFFLGVEPGNFNEAVAQAQAGYSWIALRATDVQPAPGDLGAPAPIQPVIHDSSSGAVPADVFETILRRIVDNAKDVALHEATSTPDSSGRSKEAGFGDAKAPRLALLASEYEQSQNTAIHMLELAFSSGRKDPTGSVTWAREFNLLTLRSKVTDLFDLLAKAEVNSARLSARALTIAAREDGIIVDNDEALEVEEELAASARAHQVGDLLDGLVLMAGPAKVAVEMDVLEAMGLFVDGEGNDRMVDVVPEGGPPSDAADPLAEAPPPPTEKRSLRDVVRERLEELAEAEDRRSMQGASTFDLFPDVGDVRPGRDGGPPVGDPEGQPTVPAPPGPARTALAAEDAAGSTG